jgi:hypothetical protein
MRMRTLPLLLALLASVPALAAEPPRPTAIAARVDHHIDAGLKSAGIKPAELADDAEFLRRVTLDLVGRIPTVAEARAFLNDNAGDKRARLIDRLLDSPDYPRHFATLWRKALLPQTENALFAGLADGFEEWLRGELAKNTPYDQLVRVQLTTSVVEPRRDRKEPPVAFQLASELKPENLASNTAKVFLGINLECAQCHDHPFARWTKQQFWSQAAFFTPPAKGETALKVAIPGTERNATATFLNGDAVPWPKTLDETTGRTVLADWITARDNPFFARNAVNRVWAQLFGTGLVEPLDDLSAENPASHPELLKELAEAFRDSGYDTKALVRALTLSQTYQRSSASPGASSDDNRRLFARAAVRALSGEQLHDSLLTAAGLPPAPADAGVRSERGVFAGRFRSDRPGLTERSVPQTLTLYNGALATELTRPDRNPTLRAVAGSPFLDDAGRAETLYLATLGRKPTAEERDGLVKYVRSGGPHKDRSKALADVFWALLNGTEFNTNH